MRVLFILVAFAILTFFGQAWLTKENLVVLVVGLLTVIGLLRVLTHESKCAAKEVFPSLIGMAEDYYAFRIRLDELQAEFQGARPRGTGTSLGEPAAECQPANRSG